MSDVESPDVQAMVQSLLDSDASHGLEVPEIAAVAEDAPEADSSTEEPVPQAAEQPKEEAEEAAPEDEGPASRGWAAVKKQEKKIREEREAMRAEKAQWDLQAKQIQEQKAQLDGLYKQIEENPLKLFENNPAALRHLLERVVNDGAPGTTEIEDKTEKKLRELEEKQQAWETRQEQAKVAEYDRQYRSGIENTLKTDEYKLLTKMPNAATEIYNLALAYAEETRQSTGTPQIISPKQAADAILDAYKKSLRETYSSEEVKAILAEASGASVTSIADARRTVTNRTPAARKSEMPKGLSDNELLDKIFNDVISSAKR
jgi:hypothetical protein